MAPIRTHRVWLVAAGLLFALDGIAHAQAPEAPVPPTERPTVTVADPGKLQALEERIRLLEAKLALPPPDPLITAGFSNNAFWISSRSGSFRFSPSLRAHIDLYLYAPTPEKAGGPRDTFALRRARPELVGSFFNDRVTYMLAGDLSNFADGIAATDVFAAFHIHDWFHVQVGQFDLPFTIENRTSDKYVDFMERSFVVRNLGLSNKEPGLMLYGSPKDYLFYYSVGISNGSGVNLANLDNNFDVLGRFFFRPLVRMKTPFRRLQVGASAQWGLRHLTNQPYLGGAAAAQSNNWLTLQSNTAILKTVYNNAAGGQVGVVPEGQVGRAAAELMLPIWKFQLRAEYIYMHQDVDENLISTAVAQRKGGLVEAHGTYVQISYWPIGEQTVLPDAGLETPATFHRTGDAPKSQFHLELLARYEWVRIDYGPGAAQGMVTDGSPLGARYDYWALGLGANLWWTRHVRLTANYILNNLDSSLTLAPQHTMIHEIDFRVGLAL